MQRLWMLGLVVLCGCASATTASIKNERTGEVTTLEQLRGRVVVINFWADWCQPCIGELPDLVRLVEEAGPEVVLVPAYYAERPGNRSRFHLWLANQPTYFRDRVCFVDRSLRNAHDLDSIPLTVIYGRDGTVFQQFRGSIVKRNAEFSAALDLAKAAPTK